jgi:hypothetical protein
VLAQLPDFVHEIGVGTLVGRRFEFHAGGMLAYDLRQALAGNEFLYNLNRFNVATWARCACILVGSPWLFTPECRTPWQMELANALCRYAGMSKTVGFQLSTL